MSSPSAKDVDVEKKIRQAFAEGKLKGLHGMLVTLKGERFAEVYFKGKDQSWGRPTGIRQHGPDTLHDLRSVTKSIVGLLYGIALSESAVPGPEASLIAGFPEYADLASDPERQKITVADALTMQMGIEWNENLPYSDPYNSEIAMERAKYRYRFILEQKIISPPSEQWHYNGGTTALIARLIAKGTGKNIDQYAAEKLFAPLGITNFEWAKGRDGEPSAASGLRLTSRDLAKIGQLVSNNGRYKGQQILPAAWLKAAFTPRAQLEDGLRYGYHWYLAPWGNPPAWLAGFGNGGQRITVQPKHDLVIVIFAGNYNQPDAWKMPVRVLEEYVFPAWTRNSKRK